MERNPSVVATLPQPVRASAIPAMSAPPGLRTVTILRNDFHQVSGQSEPLSLSGPEGFPLRVFVPLGLLLRLLSEILEYADQLLVHPRHPLLVLSQQAYSVGWSGQESFPRSYPQSLQATYRYWPKSYTPARSYQGTIILSAAVQVLAFLTVGSSKLFSDSLE